MSAIPKYENDGSGRDTFINHAGAYWMNPLPGGTYHKSMHSGHVPPGTSTRGRNLMETIDPFASVRPPGQDLYGKSRYGTTVLHNSTYGGTGDGADGSGAPADGTGATLGADGAQVPFDPEATALDVIPGDVPNPESRLANPGHATTGLEGTGGSTFTGAPGPWTAPKAVDSTLLRLKPTYESTCHYGLRTGRVYCPDEAPDPEVTLLDKSKTRYY